MHGSTNCNCHYETKAIDQVIIGAESLGSHPGRECKIQWVRNIVAQCKAAGVACFVKQIHMWQLRGSDHFYKTQGEMRKKHGNGVNGKRVLLKYPRDKELFPKDLRVWEYPSTDRTV